MSPPGANPWFARDDHARLHLTIPGLSETRAPLIAADAAAGRSCRLLMPLLLVGLAATLAACGAQRDASVAHGVIKIRSGVSGASLRKSVLGITTGTNASTVRAKLGFPFAKVRSDGDTCWAYHAEQPGTPLDALDFCINSEQRVRRILTGVHF
jgi:hypothetical protein